jgi:hypothetical protein
VYLAARIRIISPMRSDPARLRPSPMSYEGCVSRSRESGCCELSRLCCLAPVAFAKQDQVCSHAVGCTQVPERWLSRNLPYRSRAHMFRSDVPTVQASTAHPFVNLRRQKSGPTLRVLFARKVGLFFVSSLVVPFAGRPAIGALAVDRQGREFWSGWSADVTYFARRSRSSVRFLPAFRGPQGAKRGLSPAVSVSLALLGVH